MTDPNSNGSVEPSMTPEMVSRMCDWHIEQVRELFAELWDAGAYAISEGRGSDANPWREYGR